MFERNDGRLHGERALRVERSRREYDAVREVMMNVASTRWRGDERGASC